jgi:hypothetical protein
MTLILAALTERCVVQMSDRRLTNNGSVVEEGANKAIALSTPDSRMTVAFTGIAHAGSFNTRDWLMDTIASIAKDEVRIHGIVQQLAERATVIFDNNTALKSLGADVRRLEIVFAGYSARAEPYPMICAQVSNFEGAEAKGQFSVSWQVERRPTDDTPNLFLVAGYDGGLIDSDVVVIRKAMKKGAGPHDLVSVMHSRAVRIADREGSRDMINKKFDVIMIERDSNEPITLSYETDAIARELPAPATIMINGPGQVFMTKDTVVTVGDPLEIALVPRVHRNAPCPCGSTKRYRECHRPRC